jgi:hypothetical protein
MGYYKGMVIDKSETGDRTMTNLTKSPEDLASVAADITMNSAAAYINRNNMKVLDYKVATEVMRDFCKRAVIEALDDAKAAIKCGMTQVAEVTFRASMTKAGLDAVEVLVADGVVA